MARSKVKVNIRDSPTAPSLCISDALDKKMSLINVKANRSPNCFSHSVSETLDKMVSFKVIITYPLLFIVILFWIFLKKW